MLFFFVMKISNFKEFEVESNRKESAELSQTAKTRNDKIENEDSDQQIEDEQMKEENLDTDIPVIFSKQINTTPQYKKKESSSINSFIDIDTLLNDGQNDKKVNDDENGNIEMKEIQYYMNTFLNTANTENVDNMNEHNEKAIEDAQCDHNLEEMFDEMLNEWEREDDENEMKQEDVVEINKTKQEQNDVGYIDTVGNEQNKETQQNRSHELSEWLKLSNSLEYLAHFVLNGYDSLEYVKDIIDINDLYEIGIEDKEHQKKLMMQIKQLWPDENVMNDEDDDDDDDELKEPGNVIIVAMENNDNDNDNGEIEEIEIDQELESWLELLGLSQYLANFISNGYETLEFVKDIHDENDLLEIAISAEEHQKKLMMEIRLLQNDEGNRDNEEIKERRQRRARKIRLIRPSRQLQSN